MRRRKTALVLLVCSTLFAVSGNAQCPEKRSLWDRIVYLRDSSKPAFHDQLTELLPYVERIGQCHDRNDSTYTLLLLRVAWLISQEKDYVKAIGVTNQAIGIIHAHAGEPAISQKQLLRGYINLRIYYDSLNQDGLKKEASDSCISVALRLGTGYEYASPLIALRTQDLYESGDYYRCIGYATLGEAMARKNGGTPGDIFFILVWKINSLIELNRYDEAGVLLQKTLAECREKGNKEYLGSIYGMMARISGEKGDKEKAVLYSKQSFSYDERIGNRKGCAESLSNLGLQLYFKKLHQYDVALRCFNKALHYAIAPDSIALFDNIANVYAEKGLYDSAFYYFNRAFAVLGPGMNENKLLEDPRAALVDGTFANYLADMVLNKGDVYLKKYKSTRGKEALRQAITIYATIDRLFDKIRESQT
ncbi:MAG TPA: tetratricopeptide repeat protein, partial [Puia sp.]|nr:tetratricopeptide repeat protein [Puia sp.]